MESHGFSNKTRLGDLKKKKACILDRLPGFKGQYTQLSGQLFDGTDRIESDLTYLTPIQIKIEK